MAAHKQGLRKRLLWGLSALFVIGTAACSVQAEQTSLVFFSYPHAGYLEGHQYIADLYMKQHPDVKITVVSGWDDKLQAMLASGSPPDLFEREAVSHWKDWLLDLTPLTRTDKSGPASHIPAGLMRATTFDQKLLAIPGYWYSYNMVYNVDRFAAAGVAEPQESWTWDDFRADARKLTQDTNGDGKADLWGAAVYSNPHHKIQPLLWSFGGGLFNESLTKATVASPESVQALEFAFALSTQDHSMPGWTVDGSPLFLGGKVGMMSATLSYAVPNSTEGTNTTYEIAPEPLGPAGRASGLVVDWLGIAAQTKHPQAAYDFLKFVVSEQAQRAARAANPSLPFAHVPVGDQTLTQELFSGPGRPYNKHLWVDAIAYARDLDSTVPANADTVLNKYFPLIEQGKMSVANAAKGLQTELQALITSKQ